MQTLMQRFEKCGFFVIVKKCYLASRAIQFLGHQVTNEGIAQLNEKREDILERARPRTVT